MAGERRLDRRLQRVGVAHLADHDHIGVRPQDGPQAAGEREPRLVVRLALVDTGQPVLDGVFDRDDVLALLGNLRERRVEGRRLAAAGWTGHQQNAFGAPDHLAKLIEGRVRHELVERQLQVGAV